MGRCLDRVLSRNRSTSGIVFENIKIVARPLEQVTPPCRAISSPAGSEVASLDELARVLPLETMSTASSGEVDSHLVLWHAGEVRLKLGNEASRRIRRSSTSPRPGVDNTRRR